MRLQILDQFPGFKETKAESRYTFYERLLVAFCSIILVEFCFYAMQT